MPNRNYIRGRAAEYAVRAKLERAGWTVFRFPGSKPFDLIALRPAELLPAGNYTVLHSPGGDFTVANNAIPVITTTLKPGHTYYTYTSVPPSTIIRGAYEVAVVEVKSGEFSRAEVQEEAGRARELLPGARFFLFHRVKREGKKHAEWVMEEL